jgi:lipopolysaccharide/colanic/teichoic acid biosynthesis glycosyltransferase
MKRLLDIAVAAAGLVVTAPLLAVLAAAIKLDSPGPALFVQTRVGRDRRPIRIAKLRTMVADPARAARDERDGLEVAAAGDPRITRVGAVLRRTKLDELPQLWNVLVGDMSLVGPRPEVPHYVAGYRPEWQRLLTVRPGLTDAASLAFRDEERLLALARDRRRAYTDVVMPMKLALAVDGLAHSSVLHDLGVIARTALAVIRPRDPADDPVIREVIRRIDELNHQDRHRGRQESQP